MASGPRAPIAADWLTFEIVPDLVHEIGRQAGFGDKSVASGGAGAVAFSRQRVGAQRDDQEMTRRQVRPSADESLPSRQCPATKDPSGSGPAAASGLVDSLAAIARGLGPEPAELEIVAIHLARIVEVLDDENEWLVRRIAHAGASSRDWSARG